ncbi:MAG: flagellar protein G [Halorientalis sp.]
MAGTSTSVLIIFVASILAASVVAGGLLQATDGISSAVDSRSADVATDIATDVQAISDPAAGVYDNGTGNVSIYLKNTGSRTIPADEEILDVFVDGVYERNVTLTVASGSDWRPHNVVRVVIDAGTLASGDHRVKFVLDGAEEVFRFRT